MANTYDTKDLPVGTTDVKALFDNASNFDEFSTSEESSFEDRLGNIRQTLAGLYYEFQQLLLRSGFETTHLVYTNGTPLVVSRPTQLIDRAPSVYRVKTPATFPVTLTGNWATDQNLLVDVGDQSVRADMLALFATVPKYADLCAHQSDFVICRHASQPIQGTSAGGVYAFPGNALSASTFRWAVDKMPKARVRWARWILVWDPEVSDPASPTSVRLVKFDDGPANITQVAAILPPVGVVSTSPRTDAVDVTDALNTVLAGGVHKQFGHQTFGNGANGCLIYSSVIEVVWEPLWPIGGAV